MTPNQPTPRFALLMAVALTAVSACSSPPGSSGSTTLPPQSTTAEGTPSAGPSAGTAPAIPGIAVVRAGGVEAWASPGGEVSYRAAQGLVFPIMAQDGGWFQVLTTCNTEEWVKAAEVDALGVSDPQTPGPGFDLSRAVIVLDPGHGGRDLGAKGATGSNESDANLAISTLLAERLRTPQDVDWETGHVKVGGQYPAIAEVLMTRGPAGPNGGDYELGLAFRAEIANRAGADALVSIHNNTSPSATSATPGSDVYYAVSSPGSDRLASLIHQELVKGLSVFAAAWGAGNTHGPQARVDSATGDDFYGLLRRTVAPAVIVEGLYISEPAEEELLKSPLVLQAYADAVYRGLIRFLTSEDTGSPVMDPVPFDGEVGTPSTASCVVPSQPD